MLWVACLCFLVVGVAAMVRDPDGFLAMDEYWKDAAWCQDAFDRKIFEGDDSRVRGACEQTLRHAAPLRALEATVQRLQEEAMTLKAKVQDMLNTVETLQKRCSQ